MPDPVQKTTNLRCDVAVIGAGPVGLLLGIELGMRGLHVVILERRPGPVTQPAAHHHAARSMEHCRRLGLAQAIREAGLPRDFRPDVTYWTRLGEHELARLMIPSSAEASAAARLQEELWPTPELPHRCAQSFFEPILAAAARRQKTVRLYYGWSATEVAKRDGDALVTAMARDGDGALTVQARYVVGCDGPKSLVRDAIGARFSGGRHERSFFGGQMLGIYFSCPGLYEATGAEPAWHYWLFNQDFRALIVSVDGRGNFVMNVQPPPNDNPQHTARLTTSRVCGNLPCSIHSVSPWTAGHALAADRYRGGRLLIAGDAAHLFTPTGGMGYNTGVGDAANLAWKLAAVCRGWAPEALLDSYGTERGPIAVRNTAFSRQTADRLEKIVISPLLEEASDAGVAERRRLGAMLGEHARLEFIAPGAHLGEGYPQSAIVVGDGTSVEDKLESYTPTAVPGMRAPHAWCRDGSSLFDHFGFGFALLALRQPPSEAKPMIDAAAAGKIPLHVVARQETEIRDLYQADFVLVRPDHHVAWRGNAMPADPAALLAKVTGAA